MNHQDKNVTLTIDGQQVTVPEGTRILEAARKANVHIPTLCDHPDLCKRAVCRVCVVEADERGKLLASCANNVWEGVNIITNNARLQSIRKTIIELILANHPQDCLSCVRNTRCELQSLAEYFGIRTSVFRGKNEEKRPPRIESAAFVRDMDKCVKCGRCVESCQEISAVNSSYRSGKYEINSPYGQPLAESNCVFCGKCAAVCPVGALYGHDQSAEVQTALDNKERHVIAQAAPELIEALNAEFHPAAHPLTAGKMVTAIKLLGCKKVFNASLAANIASAAQCTELQERVKNRKKLPMLTCCSDGAVNFIANSYPDLTEHLSAKVNAFTSTVKKAYIKTVPELNEANVTTVTFASDISQKYQTKPEKNDFVLTAAELARMITLSGIMIHSLPETQFDTVDINTVQPDINKEMVNGAAQARKVMDKIRKGEYDSQWIELSL